MSVRSVRLGAILGVPVRLDWSVVVIFGLISWSLSAAVYPGLVGGYQPAEYWVAGIATALLFFTSLLAHELSHSVVAQRLGIGVRDITLWLFGGVSTIEGEAHTPRDEMKIAIAGPATERGYRDRRVRRRLGVRGRRRAATVDGMHVVARLDQSRARDLQSRSCCPVGRRPCLARLALASPGRSRPCRARPATPAGRAFGWILVTLGFIEFATTDAVGGIWFVLLGLFLISAARGEEAQVRNRVATSTRSASATS